MNLRRLMAPMLGAAMILAACGPEPDDEEPPAQRGRAETRTIRNTEAVGYSGDAVADKVDEALDALDRRTAELQSATDP